MDTMKDIIASINGSQLQSQAIVAFGCLMECECTGSDPCTESCMFPRDVVKGLIE